MDTDATNLSKRIGFLNKSLYDIRKDWQNGFGLKSFTNIITNKDITALHDFNKAIRSGTSYGEAFNQYLSNSSMNTKRLANSFINLHKQIGEVDKSTGKVKLTQEQYNEQTTKTIKNLGQFTIQAKLASIGAKILGTALQVAFNVGISLVINTIITHISEFVNKQKELAEISKQAAEGIKNELGSLEEYTVKISKLRSELDNANTTTVRATEIRNELYEIQKDLIENYGIEKDSINLVTGSIKEQIAQIRELGKAEYESNFYSNTRGSLDTIKSLNNTHLVLDRRAWQEGLDIAGFYDFREDVIETMKEIFNSSDFVLDEFNRTWTLDTNAFDAHDALENLEKQVNDKLSNLKITDFDNAGQYYDRKKQYEAILSYLSDVNREFTKPLTDHEEELAQYIKYASKYTEEYWDLVRLRSEYEIAQEKGTEEEILKARQAFLERYNGLIIADEDGATRWYFTKEFGKITNESDKTADTTVKNLNPIKDKLNELNSAVSELKETTDSAFSNQSTLQSAFDKIQEGAFLSADEVRKLVEICPELANEFDKTADGYTISSNALIKANDNIIQSTKKSVEAQIKGYQEVIDKYNEIKNVVGMPESARQDRLKALGITEDDIENAEQQINQLRLILGMLGISLNKIEEAVNAFDKAIEDSTKSISLIKTAMEEMSNDGHISASTYQALVEKGEDYVACLELVDGKLTLNITKLKELEVQELRNIISKNNLRISELEAQKTHGGTAEVIDKETQALARQNAVLEQQIQDVWSTTGDSGSGSSSDPTKDAYTEKQKELKHLLEMEKITQKQYYEMLFGSDEYKALLANRTKYLDELNSLDEEYYKYQQNLYKENADNQFDDLDDQYKRGIITAEQYAQGLHDLGQELYGEGSIYGGTEFAIKALEELDKKVKETSEDIYDESLDSLRKNNDGTLKSEEQFIKDWTKLNDDTWKAINPKQWEENYNEIADYTKDFYKQLLDDGVFDVSQYTQKVNILFNQLKGLGIDLGANWLSDALNDTKDIDFDRLKEKLSADGDTDINDVIADVDKLAKRDIKLFSDTPETLKKNGEEIFNSLVSSAQDALSKGLISPERYLEIIDTFADTWQEKLGLTQGVIDEAKNALEVDDWMDDWDKTHNYDEDKNKNNFELRQDRIEATRKAIIDTYGVDGVNNLKAYTDAMKEADEQQKQLNEDIYAKTKEDLSADGDRLLDDVLSDAKKLSKMNIDFFSNNEDTFKENTEDIFSSVSESARDALDKMLITPDEYIQIIDKWGDKLNIAKGLLEEAKELSEDDYLDRWDLDNGYSENKSKDDYELRAKRIEYIYELAEQLYGKNGQKDVKAYNALINQGLESVESLVEDYYDAEIKKLEKINNEEKKRQKALELQLNLIKARQKLEEAKKQRNQLIFENGTFRYDYNQEAVLSAQEDTAEAEKAIVENAADEAIQALEDQKTETLKFFDSVGEKLDDFIDRTQKFLAGDKDAFKVDESKADVEIENDSSSSDTKDKNIISKITDISDVVKDTFNIAKTLADNFNFENLVRALGGNPTSEAVKNFQDSYNATLVGKQITPSTLPSNITNNSSTTNNSAKTIINIEKIFENLYIPEGTTKEQVEEMLRHFDMALRQRVPQMILNIRK